MDENESVWNRIEKIERFILGQDKEIKNLKSALARMQSEPMHYPDPMSSLPMMQPVHHRYSAYPYHPVEMPYHRQPLHPYQMSSFVHPPSAIPPGGPARRPLAERNPYQLTNPSWLNSSPLSVPVASQNNQRYSAAPNLNGPEDDTTLDELFNEQPARKKPSRLRLVEPETESQPELQLEALSNTNPEPEPQLESQPRRETELEPERNQDQEQVRESESESESGLDPNRVPDSGTDTDLDLGLEAGLVPNLTPTRIRSPQTPPLPEVEIVKVVPGNSVELELFEQENRAPSPSRRIERPRAAKMKFHMKSTPKRSPTERSHASLSNSQHPPFYGTKF